MSAISELFDRDPLKLTRDDVSAIVEEMRQKRALFNAEGAKPKAAKKGADPALSDDLLKEIGLG